MGSPHSYRDEALRRLQKLTVDDLTDSPNYSMDVIQRAIQELGQPQPENGESVEAALRNAFYYGQQSAEDRSGDVDWDAKLAALITRHCATSSRPTEER